MKGIRFAALTSVLAVGLGGCATMRENRTTCRVVSTLVGGTVGALGGGLGTWAYEGSNDTSGGKIAAGASIGLLGGGLAGFGLGTALCPEEAVPPPPPPPAPRKIETFESPLFDFDKATLRPLGFQKCDRVAAAVKSKGTQLVVTGYTDSVGSDAYNLQLGERRAESVKKCLAERGVATSRITVRSKGEADPVASNETAEGRQNNRRVEVVEQ
jgi:outer membrane protein OmpA-like peptidoglycan-associated protein